MRRFPKIGLGLAACMELCSVSAAAFAFAAAAALAAAAAAAALLE